MESREGISGVTVISPEAPSSYNVAPRTENSTPAPAIGIQPMTPSVASSGLLATSEKKKRGRPRKHGPDGSVRMVLSPTPISSSAPPASGNFNDEKPSVVQPTVSEKKHKNKIGIEKLGEWVSSSTGGSFLPHLITVDTGENSLLLLLVHYYGSHPLAEYNLLRSSLVRFLTLIWSIRLSHNYFRREEWQWGAREDWRFTDMRQQYGKNWWWVSFFAIYLSQQVFLMGICMPFYIVHSKNKDFNIWDVVAALTCLTGIVIAYYADTQLHTFVSRNNELKKLGQPMVPCLEEGLWRYSRHPNYFGEQLWWWGLFIFAWNLGSCWSFIGALINSMCLAYVTGLVEKRMLEKDYRADAYRQYQEDNINVDTLVQDNTLWRER